MLCVGFTAARDTDAPTPTPEEAHSPLKTLEVWQVWASLQGVPLEVPQSVHSFKDRPSINLNFICIGNSEHHNNSFTGFVTGFTLKEGEGDLTPDNCSLLLEENLLKMPLANNWRHNSFVIALEENLQDPCNTTVLTLVLHEAWDHDKAQLWCRSLGGHLPTQEEAAASDLVNFNCTSEEYLSWTSDASEREDGPAANCPVLLANGSMEQRECLSELRCSFCLVPNGLSYTLFGDQTDFDRHYNLRAWQNGSFFFHGKTSNITLGAAGWTLQSRLHRRHLHLNGNVGVMGRHTWRSQNQAHATYKLTFTVCNALQFSTNDGVCLRRSERCDGLFQGPDKSGEEGCGRRRHLGRNEHYSPDTRPRHVTNSTLYNNSRVWLVHKMKAEKDTATVEITTVLQWMDDRLKFIDPRKHANKFPCHLIWTPDIAISAGDTDGPAVYPTTNNTVCYFNWPFDSPQKLEMDDPFMGEPWAVGWGGGGQS
ncbi:uncharacterized protein LOC123509538 [Portunus trituberculatus]|uniref:uncharacterized protein LOC123509538 n=1 Tax=Portunus trituberculatus TaxID=210409 RepID=UPI001E1CDE2A|nr:uncharacterized protein LOC123509538 [Portunus trituberculatus]